MSQQPPNERRSDAVLDRLMSLHPKIIDLSLDRAHDLLNRLGNPERALPPVIHVAGTNGKGSTIAYMRAALEQAGYAVHVFTSPHLVKFNERVRLAGEEISEEDLTAFLEECEDKNAGIPITFFEITTCAAILAFSRVPADVLILETGLGGRLDATNVVNKPALTVITEISIDHQQFLGNTLFEIAGEKAGIMKHGVPCVSARQEADTVAVLEARAKELNVDITFEGPDWSIHPIGNGFTLRQDGEDQYLPKPGLRGKHQIHNAGVAVQALSKLEGFSVPGPALARGLQMAEWPARFQRLAHGPLVDALPADWELWLDGGHNEAAALVIADEVTTWSEEGDDKPLHLIFGMLNSKDPMEFLKPLQPHAASIMTLDIPGEPNALSAQSLATTAAEAGLNSAPALNAQEALDTIIKNNNKPTRVLICGSLYLAGEILSQNG